MGEGAGGRGCVVGLGGAARFNYWLPAGWGRIIKFRRSVWKGLASFVFFVSRLGFEDKLSSVFGVRLLGRFVTGSLGPCPRLAGDLRFTPGSPQAF